MAIKCVISEYGAVRRCHKEIACARQEEEEEEEEEENGRALTTPGTDRQTLARTV